MFDEKFLFWQFVIEISSKNHDFFGYQSYQYIITPICFVSRVSNYGVGLIFINIFQYLADLCVRKRIGLFLVRTFFFIKQELFNQLTRRS